MVEDKRKLAKSKETKNKIKSGTKAYHSCCAKVNCSKKTKSKPNALKSKTPSKLIEKMPTKTKVNKKTIKKPIKKPIKKRKPFITPEMIDDIKDKDATNNPFSYYNKTNKRGNLDKLVVLGDEYCARIKLISKIYKKYKNNDFKIRTYTKEDYPFDGFGEKNLLLDFIRRVGGYNSEIDNIRIDCGEEEANIVNRVYNELIKNKNKIQSRLKKNTPKWLV